MTFGAGSLWVNSSDSASVVSRINPATRRVIASIKLLHPGGGDITYAFGSIWAVNRTAATVTRIDPHSNSVVATIPTLGASPFSIAASQREIWVANRGQGKPVSGAAIVAIDPATNRTTTTIPLAGSPVWLGSTGSEVWAADPDHHAIVEISTQPTAKVTYRIAWPSINRPSYAISDDKGYLWFSDGGSKPRLEELDPSTRTIRTVLSAAALARYHLQNIDGLTYGAGSIWLSGFCGPGAQIRGYAGWFFCVLRTPRATRVSTARTVPIGGIGRFPERSTVALAYDGRLLWFGIPDSLSVQPINPKLAVVCGPYKWHGAGMFASDCHTKKP